MDINDDVLTEILERVTVLEIREGNHGAFLQLARVSSQFKRIMYSPKRRRMFMTQHASFAKKYTTWKEIGPRCKMLLSNPLVYFSDRIILDCISQAPVINYEEDEGGDVYYDLCIKQEENMKLFFGHRGQVKQHNRPNKVHKMKVENKTFYFGFSDWKCWKFSNKIYPSVCMILNPNVYDVDMEDQGSIPYIVLNSDMF